MHRFNRTNCLLWLLCSISLTLCMYASCTSFDTLATTILAILGGVNIVLASIGAVIAAPEVTAIEAGVTIAENAVNALKTTVDNYEANKTGTGLVADIQSAVAAVQASLSGLLAAAQIKNTTLQNWIAKIVALIGTVVQEVVTDIIPNLAAARDAHLSGNDAPALSLDQKVKDLAVKLRAEHEAALAESDLPDMTKAAVKTHVDHALAHHIGPIRV